MKKSVVFLLLLLSFQGYSQENEEIKTIFGNLNSSGGYGGISLRYSLIGDNDAFVNGGRGGWVINHNLAIGGGGYSFQTESIYDKVIDYNCRLTGGYGGLLIEPIIYPRSIIHLSFPVLIGAGGASYRIKTGASENIEDWQAEDRDAFMVLEPGIEIELNVVKFMRIGVGVYYRFTSNVDLQYENSALGYIFESDVMNGFSSGVTFKFGKF